MSKMSLLDDQNSAAAEHPSPLIYAAIRDHHVNTSKRTYLWAELVALLGRTYTVRCQAYAFALSKPICCTSALLSNMRRPMLLVTVSVWCRTSRSGRLWRNMATTTSSLWTIQAQKSQQYI